MLALLAPLPLTAALDGRMEVNTPTLDKYDPIIRHKDGHHLRAPFSHVGWYLSIQGIEPSVSERRAIENATQFLISLSIFARRLRAHLAAYKPDSWVDVPLHELFLDVQGLFLFAQQYLEDVAQVVRISLPHTQRHQMSPKFHDLSKRLRDELPSGEPFKVFLDEHASWFDEMKDVRDDICHRTAYGRVRSGRFPELFEVLRAGSGLQPFLSGRDLRSYVGGLFRRVLALSCVAESFVYSGILRQHPEEKGVPPAIVLGDDEFDPTVSTSEPLFPLGTVIMTFSRSTLENLEYFLKPESEPSNPAMDPSAPQAS